MTMFLVGSGPSDTLDSVHDQFVESAKKRGTRVAVALLGTEEEAGQHLATYAEAITSRWPEAQIVPVWLDDEPEPAQNTTAWPEQPHELAGVVVAGGWTPGYLDALRPHRDLIAKLVRRGVPYLGYSAGAAVVGKRTLVGGWKFRGRQIAPEIWGEGLEELELREGLALIGPSVEVHGDVAGLGPGLAALEKGEVGTVVSIDEGTCLVVDPVSGRTTVEGSQRVHWLTRESGVCVVRHESSAAELERHEGFIAAEKEAAAREEAARREAAEKAAAEKAVQERIAAQERAARQQAEAERRAEQVRLERERLEAEEAERQAREAERARIAAEKAEAQAQSESEQDESQEDAPEEVQTQSEPEQPEPEEDAPEAAPVQEKPQEQAEPVTPREIEPTKAPSQIEAGVPQGQIEAAQQELPDEPASDDEPTSDDEPVVMQTKPVLDEPAATEDDQPRE
ncbi:hypothetical protein [Luteococcus sp. OSA5]|uniref:hypothetical protein n=1 Tax=Luteococcus sp. OSA5 TaxID=3401630 RepID=UPI003B436569